MSDARSDGSSPAQEPAAVRERRPRRPLAASPAQDGPGAEPTPPPDVPAAPPGATGATPTGGQPAGSDAPGPREPVSPGSDDLEAAVGTRTRPDGGAPVPGTADERTADDGARGRSGLRNLIEWIVVIVGALVVALLIKAFLFQAFFIPSESMEPTLDVGDRVIVNKLSSDYGRGDLGGLREARRRGRRGHPGPDQARHRPARRDGQRRGQPGVHRRRTMGTVPSPSTSPTCPTTSATAVPSRASPSPRDTCSSWATTVTTPGTAGSSGPCPTRT
ncbi:MAG: S26 family signal peptidase [Acidimicrobiia bacterium]|nr:S26 family signal peptidase [Acidimicrobiia bacterium]